VRCWTGFGFIIELDPVDLTATTVTGARCSPSSDTLAEASVVRDVS
jgi:hypothetical protein